MTDAGAGITPPHAPPAPKSTDARLDRALAVARELTGSASWDAERIDRWWGETNGDLAISWSAPRILAESLFERPDATVFWGSGAEAEVGLGCASEIHLRSDLQAPEGDRFQAIQAWSEAHLNQCLELTSPGVHPSPMRALGGFAFLPGHAGHTPWLEFGDARFLIPRFRYRVADGAACLTLWLRRDERTELQEWLRRAAALLESLAHSRTPEAQAVAAELPQPNPDESARWSEKVNAILSGISQAAWTKIVTARTLRSEFASALSLSATLAALGEAHADCVRFCFRFGGDAFIGATPEHLIQKHGNAIQTEALAGTFRLAAAEYATELLRSPKEHLEHAPVVQAIVEQLSPLCSEVHFAAQPELRTLPHLLHLRTPISGVLRAPRHVLDLVALLHPTPAVGGTPRQAALQWIAHEENFERGWYAGPVGWFQANGDGQFEVALRSGVLSGNRAQLYAGVGIVAGSEATTEYAETQLKLRSLWAALRVVVEARPGQVPEAQ
jgi:isochorismate synthase